MIFSVSRSLYLFLICVATAVVLIGSASKIYAAKTNTPETNAPEMEVAPPEVLESAAPPLVMLTLSQAVEMARRNTTPVLKGESNTEFYKMNLTKSEMQFFPLVTGVASYGFSTGRTYVLYTTPEVIDATGSIATYQLGADLNLFNGFGDVSALRSARERERSAQLALWRTRQSSIMDVVRSFLQVILDVRLLDIAQTTLKVSQDRLKLFQAQTQVGVTSVADLYREQAQTSDDQFNLISARNRVTNDRLGLIQKLRLDPNREYQIAEPNIDVGLKPEVLANENQLVRDAYAHRADLKASQSDVAAADDDVTTARSTYFPTLDLLLAANGAGRYLTRNLVNGVDNTPTTQTDLLSQVGNQTVYSATLNLSWAIFDRYQTHLNEEKAVVTEENTLVDNDDLRRQVINDIKRARNDYQSATEQLDATKLGLIAAQKAYDVLAGRYHVGSANFLDLVTAQNGLVQAQSKRAQALINFKLQVESLRYVVGRDPEP